MTAREGPAAEVSKQGEQPVISKFLVLQRSLLIFALALCLPVTQSHAAMITTERVVSDMGAERDRIADFLSRDEVKTKLVEWGVEPTEATARVAALSDSEVRGIASRMDRLPAAGDGLYIGLGTLLLIGIILLLIYR